MVGDADASDPAASMAALAVADRGDWLSDVARVVGEGGPAPSDLARWRRTESPELIAAAIDLVRARRSLAPRFPEAAAMLADRAGAAMASDAAAATAKARRIAGVRPRELWDLGCGIGGDSMRLASIDGLERLVLVDLDPARLAMARHNVGLVAPSLPVETIRGDAAELAPEAAEGRLVHLDPARRDAAGRRSRARDLEDLEPGPQSIAAIIERSRHVVLKLGPGTDPDAMPRWPEPSVEYVARGRDLVQAVAWYGRSGGDPPGSRRASIAPDGPSLTGTPDDSLDPTVLGPPPQDVRDWLQRPPAWLLIPHPAAERARLVSAALREAGGPVAGMAPLAAGLGIIASPIDPGSPWLEAIPIREAMPWRAPRVRRRLAELGTGEVVLRTRGRAIDPDAAVGAVRGAAGPTRTVVVLRLGRERVAFIGDV
jgi:hypothetical protein